MKPFVIGLDGCRSGWIACHYDISHHITTFRPFSTFADVLSAYSEAAYIAVDIPIGLRNDGEIRRCDAEARRMLSPERGSSVFSAPARCLLEEVSFEAVNRKSRLLFDKGISQQSFNIFRKIREVDCLMTAERQDWIFEVHPELCFKTLAGRALVFGKKKREGYEERRQLLNECLGMDFPSVAKWHDVGISPGSGVNRDDVLDAAVAARTALRMYRGNSLKIPSVPEIDEKGLRMEIVY